MSKQISIGEFIKDSKPRGDNADFFNLKEKGKAIIFLHPKSGIYKRDIHWFPAFGTVGVNGVPVDKPYMTMIVHDTVKNCLICKLRKALRDNDDIDSDEVILRLGEGEDLMEYNKGEITGEEGYGWQRNLAYKSEYIFGIIEKDEPSKAYTLISTKSLGKKITKVIEDQIEEEGEVDGNPFEAPYAFKITFDKSAQPSDMYDATWNKAPVTKEIQETLDAEGPDNSHLVEVTSTAKVAYLIRYALVMDEEELGLDLSAADEFDPNELNLFQNQAKKSTAEDDEEDEEDEEDEAPKKPAKKKAAKKKAVAKKPQVECPACGEDIDEDANECEHCNVEFEEETIECPDCGKDIPADSDVCPHCKSDVSPF